MIYKIVHWDAREHHLYIQTNATREQLEDVIDKVKEKDNYADSDIVPALLEAGYLAENITPLPDEELDF